MAGVTAMPSAAAYCQNPGAATISYLSYAVFWHPRLKMNRMSPHPSPRQAFPGCRSGGDSGMTRNDPALLAFLEEQRADYTRSLPRRLEQVGCALAANPQGRGPGPSPADPGAPRAQPGGLRSHLRLGGVGAGGAGAGAGLEPHVGADQPLAPEARAELAGPSKNCSGAFTARPDTARTDCLCPPPLPSCPRSKSRWRPAWC
jgi:hypothetical protein